MILKNSKQKQKFAVMDEGINLVDPLSIFAEAMGWKSRLRLGRSEEVQTDLDTVLPFNMTFMVA